MAEDLGRNRLGRGLAALIGDVSTESEALDHARGQRHLPIEFLTPNRYNPRRNFPEADLEDLASSIRSKGVLQPILVRSLTGLSEAYEIVAGERRWRAAQLAGLTDVPVQIVSLSDKDALEVALVENIQRSDLNPIEEALGYERLIAEFGYTQDGLAKTIGKSRSHVANTLRLLKLSDTIQAHIEAGRLSAGHARALITSDHAERLADHIIAGDLSVRDAEDLARREPDVDASIKKTKAPETKSADISLLEQQLKEHLGLQIAIRDKGGRGEVRIRYSSLDQLDGLLTLLRRP